METIDDLVLSYLRRKGSVPGDVKNDAPTPAEKDKGIKKKKIVKHARKEHRGREESHTPTDDDVEDALSRLVIRGKVTKDGKYYSISVGTARSDGASVDATASKAANVPIAEIIRRERQKTDNASPFDESKRTDVQTDARLAAVNDRSEGDDASDPPTDMDEEIRRLEAELEASDDDEDDDSDMDSIGSVDRVEDPSEKSIRESRSSNGDGSRGGVSFGGSTTRTFFIDRRGSRGEKSDEETEPYSDNGVINLSSVADDRISPLPSNALPQNKRRVIKAIDAASALGDEKSKKMKKTKKRKLSDVDGKESDDGDGRDAATARVSEGLSSAVAEVLQGYVTSAALGKPAFYCRVCRHQCTDENDLAAHRKTELCREARKAEMKATYCRLCKKQMTSLDQMEVHMRSRPHRQLMDTMKARQRGDTVGRGDVYRTGGGRGSGRFADSGRSGRHFEDGRGGGRFADSGRSGRHFEGGRGGGRFSDSGRSGRHLESGRGRGGGRFAGRGWGGRHFEGGRGRGRNDVITRE